MSFPLLPGDAAVQAAMDSIRTIEGSYVFINLSELAGPLASLGIWAIATVGLSLRRKYRLALGLAVAFLGSNLAWLALKQVLARPRPGFAHTAFFENGWSFPSGHATNAFALAVFASIVIARHVSGRMRVALIAALILFAATIAFARVYLGVHYLSDVLAGALLGCIFGVIGAYASRQRG